MTEPLATMGHNSQHRQTVYRRHSNRAHTAILNSFLQDGRISHEAKGLVAEMLSYPEDWDFTVQYLTKNGKSGRDKIYRMLKEAEKFGYIVPFQYRALDGRIQRQTYLVSDDPEALIRAVAEELHDLEKLGVNDPLPEKPEVGKPLLTNPLPEKPDTVNQELAQPLPEKPDTAQPDTVFPTQTKNTYNKKTKDKGNAGASAATPIAECWKTPKGMMAAGTNTDEARAQRHVWLTPLGSVEISEEMRAEMAKVFPLVDPASALAAAAPNVRPEKGATACLANVRRQFGYMQQDAVGRERRANARSGPMQQSSRKLLDDSDRPKTKPRPREEVQA